MIVWGVFNGGANYSPGSVHELRDIEEFPTMRAAGVALWRRVRGWEGDFPNVDADASLHLWFACPNDGAGDVQEYPDRVVTVGPRGGIRVERV
jgi:hypothetical protein